MGEIWGEGAHSPKKSGALQSLDCGWETIQIPAWFALPPHPVWIPLPCLPPSPRLFCLTTVLFWCEASPLFSLRRDTQCNFVERFVVLGEHLVKPPQYVIRLQAGKRCTVCLGDQGTMGLLPARVRPRGVFNRFRGCRGRPAPAPSPREPKPWGSAGWAVSRRAPRGGGGGGGQHTYL